MRNTLIIFNLLLLFLHACKDKSQSIYEGCCGTAPLSDTMTISISTWNPQGQIEDSLVMARVFLPNIVMVGGNDFDSGLFMVCATQVAKVVSLKITSNTGELLFSQSNFLPYDAGMAWVPEQANGGAYTGRFDYTMEVQFLNGATKQYSGSACAVACGADDFPNENLPECVFVTQNDGLGGINTSLPIPNECFE